MCFVLLAVWSTVKIFMVSYLKCSNSYCLYFELYQKLLQHKYYYIVMDNKRNCLICCKRWIDCTHGFQNASHSHLEKSDLLVGLQQCSLLHWNVLRINLVKEKKKIFGFPLSKTKQNKKKLNCSGFCWLIGSFLSVYSLRSR